MSDDVRITELAEYGQHIKLYCRNHPNKAWSTKNIAPLGCRTIFYNLRNVGGMGPECDCAMSDLRVSPSVEHY